MIEFRKETLEFVKTENQYQKPFYILLCICLILILSLCFAFNVLEQQNKKLKQIEVKKISFQIENLKTLKQVDSFIDILPFSDKITCKKQYRIESANLTSNLTIKNKNVYGMCASKRRHTYSSIDKNGYAVYENIQLSVIDRLLYDIYVGTSLKGYATDKNYFKKLNIKK
jgi:hypothetical protein